MSQLRHKCKDISGVICANIVCLQKRMLTLISLWICIRKSFSVYPCKEGLTHVTHLLDLQADRARFSFLEGINISENCIYVYMYVSIYLYYCKKARIHRLFALYKCLPFLPFLAVFSCTYKPAIEVFSPLYNKNKKCTTVVCLRRLTDIFTLNVRSVQDLHLSFFGSELVKLNN